MKQEHYYSENPTSEFKLKIIQAFLRSNNFKFYTSLGVFSKNKIDKGTALLADNMLINNDDVVLDIGCGIGVLGITVAKIFPKARVLMTDINKRAVKLAKMNLELNKICNAEVRYSNLYENVEGKFNTILVNPPQTAGKKICFEIIEKAKSHLEKRGLLQIVARHNKGGKELSKKMEEVFGNVKEIAKSAGYRVYVGEKLEEKMKKPGFETK